MAKEFLGSIFSWRNANNDGDKSLRAPPPGRVESLRATASPAHPIQRKDSGLQRFLFKRIATVLSPAEPNNRGLRDYNQSDFRQYWMPDSRGKVCYECQTRFTTLRRRHHCRICGQIFCVRCCHLAIPGHLLGYTGDLRVCSLCAKAVVQYLQQSDLPQTLRARLLDNLKDDQPGQRVRSCADFSDAANEEGALSGSFSSIPGSSKQAKLSSDWEDLTPLFHSTSDVPSWPDSLPRSSSLQMLSGDEARLALDETPLPAPMDDSALDTEVPDLPEPGLEEPDWLRNLEPSWSGPQLSDVINAGSSQVSSASSVTVVKSAPPTLLLPAEEVDSHPLSPTHSDVPLTPTMPAEGGQKLAVAFSEYQERMLDYLLHRENLPGEWKAVLLPLAREIAHSLRPDTRNRKDKMDAAHYLHVKLWQDSKSVPSCRVVFGTVFSKSIADTRMRKRIPHPKIMIARGGIEYERTNRFTSFEPILTQEESHIGALVAKIEALNPDVLVVEQTVARTALSALQSAGITLLCNVKPAVIDRVARATGAEIVMSVESLFTPPKLGTCGQFTAKTFNADGLIKHVVFLEDCPPELSSAVILTGPQFSHLVLAKQVLIAMTRLIYSGKLQQSLLSLYSTLYRPIPDNRPSACFACHPPPDAPRGRNPSDSKQVVTLKDVINDCCLHSSPFISTELPFLELCEEYPSPLRRYFKGTLYPFDAAHFGAGMSAHVMSDSIDDSVVDTVDMVEADVSPMNPFSPPALEPALITCQLTKPADSEEVQALMAEYRARSAGFLREKIDREALTGRKIHNRGVTKSSRAVVEERPLDVLSPSVHQRLTVLFSCYSDKSPNAPGFCVNPWVVAMAFYERVDVCLGNFLESFCFSAKYACPSVSCDIPMLFHVRKLVHGNYCVTITTEAIVDSPPTVPTNCELTTWAFCTQCKTPTHTRPLPRSAWQISFATFLLYLFRGKSLFVSTCSHCLTHEHHWFFSANNRVACFKLSPITIHDLRFAPPYCLLNNRCLDMTKMWNDFQEIFDCADILFAEIESHFAFYESKRLSKLDDTRLFFRNEKSEWDGAREVFSSTENFNCETLNVLDSEYIRLLARRTEFLHKLAILVQNWNLQLAVFARRLKDEKSERKSTEAESAGSDTAYNEDGSKAASQPTPSNITLSVLPPELHATLPLSDPPVLVSESDVSSVIAYCLASREYQEKMSQSRDQFINLDIAINLKESVASNENSLAGTLASADPSNPLHHIELQFSDPTTNIYCKVYFAEHFRLFRKLIFPQGEDTFIRSLAASKVWKPKGGKSGAAFYKTKDDRLILKQMSRFELHSFLKFASSYLGYVTIACTENKLTALTKVLGVFRVGLKNHVTGTALKMDLMITENLFYDCGPLTQIYDLKGSKRNRLVDERAFHDAVLMDENFVRAKVEDPLYVYPHSKTCLIRAIENDSRFLSSNRVMDYSLLVGVTSSGQLVCGLIDILRTYTLDKRLETWVKSVSGSQPPTVVSPEVYCSRFAESMEIYFPVAPDQWAGLSHSVVY